MFKRLQKKWKVNGWRLLLILVTFAVGGSLTGYAGRKIMAFTGIETAWLYIPVYIIVITFLWPLMVLAVSIPLGQLRFFLGYIRKLGNRMRIGKRKITDDSGQMTDKKSETFNPEHKAPKHIAIFASGAGSNAQKIIDHFKNSAVAAIKLIVCNKSNAGVLAIAEKENIPAVIINKERFFYGDGYVNLLKEEKIDLIVLAGFLWKIPLSLIQAYPQKIINLHPALLPGYGGKGMYGANVHNAVLTSKEKQSGITIHYVDEHYDNGDIIFQATCDVFEDDTPESLAKKIHQLEHKHYPLIIEKLLCY